MELEFGFLYTQEVKTSLNKLFVAPMHGPLLKNINSLNRQCESNFKTLQKEFQSLVKKHAELDEKGNIIEQVGGAPGSFKIKEDSVGEWNRAVAELMRKKFELKNFSKVNINQLISSGINLSSQDIQQLEPILEGLDFDI